MFLLACSAFAAPLDDRMAAFERAQTQTEASVSELLQAGLAEHRAAEAYAAARAWLAANPGGSPTLLFQAAQAAEYAGEWPDAVSFYRKLLKSSPLEAGMAGTAAPAVYRLLINNLRDETAAYLFMREEGDRLRGYGKARQFDAWFLAEAKRRNDVPAVCGRVAAMLSASPAGTAPDTENLEWICGMLESSAAPDESWIQAALKLVALPQVPETFRARVNWMKEVQPFTREATALFRANKPVPDALLDKPLKAAEALVSVLPYEGSMLAARGWMNLREGHTPNLANYLAPRREAKSVPILRALASLPPAQAQAVLAAPGCPQRRPVSFLFSPAEMRALAVRAPAILNSLAAPDVPLFDAALTVAEARTLSPLLARHPHGQAALVRAYAVAGTNTVTAMVPALMKSEMWRFDSAKSAIDLVWNSGARRDGKPDDLRMQYERPDARHDQLVKQTGKNAASPDRMAAFKMLRQDLLAPNPSIPGARDLWRALFAGAPQEDAVAMMRTLLADFGGDGEQLLREAVGVAKVGRHELCWQAVWPDNFMLNPGNRAAYFAGAAPLIPELQRILGAQAPAGRFSEFIFGLWVHAANPQDAAARAFMTQLAPTPAYARLPAAYRRAAADDLHFGPIAKTPAEAATDPAVVSRELLALPATATPAQVEAAFQAVVARASQAAEPVAVHGLQPVAALAEWSGPTRTLARALFRELSPLGAYPPDQGYDDLVFKLVNEARKPGRFGEMAPYAAGFWRAAEATSKGYFPAAAALSGSAEDALAAGERSAALSIARIGLALKGRALSGDARTGGPERVAKLRQVVDKAGLAIGMFEIPVDETDPTYPIYKSNAEFVQGNLDSAWDLFQAHAEDLLRPRPGAEQEPSLIRKLPLAYSFWLLGRTMEGGRTEEAEGLVKELTVWSREAEGIFSPEQDAELKIAYADLAFLKGALPTARAWYRKVADAGEYKGSEAQVRAALGSVKVDRVAKNFGAALEELDQLMRLKDPRFRSRVHYARAEVLMDQENFKDALAEVDAVLRQDPAQADALILRGKIQYQMRKLVEASEIELGVSQASKIMVPGETLKINLVDPTLRISGVSVDIEVEVWAKSGDREVVMLHQLGDDKEKFRAEVPTALAPPVTGDKTLQVLGVDEIRYGYSKRFREKMKDLPPDPDVVIGIASDAHLSLSAGAFPPREGERRLDVEELGLTTAQKALGLRAVRPGNPVYLRVIDPDQSRTAGVDELAVALQTSSGDEIRRLMLKETGPFTGEFEGIVPTAAAQALAFASESAPGRDPNMAISSRDYPGWLGEVGDPEKARTFGVDLNDSVALDRMSIRWGQAGARLTRFVLQTSMNGRDWTTRARYPADPAPWDGRMRASSFPTYNGGIAVSTPRGRDLPADWLEKMELTSARASCRYLAATVTNFPAGRLPMVETGHPGYSGLMQIRALFYQPAKAIRRFRLTGWPAVDGSGSPQTIFLLDGVPADAASDDPLFIERELAPGLHELQIWRHAGWDKITGTRPVLLCDVSGQEDLAPCPDRMFDPASFPPSARAQIPQPARIGEAPDGGLDVVFGASTQARLVRLAIQGFEGVAPAIKSVTLTDRAGTARLPVAGDFMTLRQNAQLEVLPGDTIIARYEDEVTATPRRDRHEQRLQVAFNTASITASFMKYETTPEGRRLLLESIRRFALGDAVAVVIDDADMDGSPAKDAVDFTVAGSGGATTTMKALETEEHSGRFVGRVFPVAGAPARESEIQMNEGGTLTLTYRDVENLDPGIPADRSVTIEHARYVTPQLGVYAVDSVALPGAGNPPRAAAPGKPPAGKESGRMAGPEVVLPRRALNYAYVAETGLAGKPLQGVIGASLRFDVVAPHLALAGSSEIAAYVQVAATNAGPAGAPFDINVPGTLKLAGRPAGAVVAAPAGYKIGHGPTPPSNTPPLEEGRFAFSVPLLLADRPARSFATAEAESLPTSSIPDGLAVRAGDVVRIGYAFKDETGQVQWKTAAVAVGSDAMLDVMNGSYTEPLTRAYVGERIFVRLLAPGLDRGAERDTASVSLRTTNGTAATLPLRETEPHSGVFKGVFALGYADAAPPSPLPPVELNGFPVRYGDEVTVGFEGQACAVAVNRGADGAVEPFSKRFTGDEMAVQTGFTLAECFFELAKQHRQMEQESLARREMAQAQKLLAEAIATHRDDELRAHAEYLLGNLAQEYADLSKNDEAKLPMYQDALARFSKIPVEYPDTEFAPKAQFKTALVYEKMGETEIAVEEYVKLAYKYPDCEYIPEVMSRLGGYFQGKGQAFKEQADPLREKTDVASQGEVLRLDELSYPEFLKAARIFAKLQERFPDHELAGLAGLRAAQNFMRAQQYEDAIARFEKVYTSEQYDGRDIRAQAMFWCGLSYERLAGIAGEGDGKARGHAMNEAYEIYRRVTFDFPDSKWAKSARGRLADPAFEKIIELEELQRERMLESLQREQKRK